MSFDFVVDSFVEMLVGTSSQEASVPNTGVVAISSNSRLQDDPHAKLRPTRIRYSMTQKEHKNSIGQEIHNQTFRCTRDDKNVLVFS